MRPTRRQVLGASALLLAAGCTDAPAPPSVVDPDDVLRDGAVARERGLLTAYDTTLAAFPELAARLLPVRTEHAEHLLALTGPPPSASPTATASPSAPPPAAAPAVPPPATAALALASLADAERAAAGAHAAACLEGSRALASLLAALAASEHSHPAVLT